MACIYHIYSTEDMSKVYIGQTTGDHNPAAITTNEGTGKTSIKYDARPMDHFSGLYSKAAQGRENPLFFEYLKSHRLDSFVVEIYTIDDNFGLGALLDEFCAEWTPNYGGENKNKYKLKQLADGSLKLGDEEEKIAKANMQYYLDAAEILHNYIAFRNKSKTCLTYQIGGQGLSFTSSVGVVLNSTMSVEEGCRVIESNEQEIAKVQKKFQEQLKDVVNTYVIDGKTFKVALGLLIKDEVIASSIRKSNRGNYSFTSATRSKMAKLFAKYIKDWLVHFYNHEGRNLELKGYELHTNFDNLFSEFSEKWEFNFGKGGKGSFTIIDALTHYFAQNKLADKISRAYKKTGDINSILKTIQDALETNLNINLPPVSFSSFVTIIPPKEKRHSNWNYSAPAEKNYAKDPNNAYGISFRYRAYYFFINQVKKVMENPDYHITNKYEYGDKTYYRAYTEHYRLSTALHRLYQQLDIQPILNMWTDYLHEMLTIFSRNNQTTLGKDIYLQEIVFATGANGDTVPLGVTTATATDEETGVDGTLAYRFAEATAEDIEYWLGRGIEQIENF